MNPWRVSTMTSLRSKLMGVLVVSTLTLLPRPLRAACIGDCTGKGSVTASDITRLVVILISCDGVANGCAAIPSGCTAGDRNGDGEITVDELMFVISNVLTQDDGCPGPSPVPTASATAAKSSTATVTPTASVASTATATASSAPTSTHSATPLPSDTPSFSATPTFTATPTLSPTAVATASATPSPTMQPTSTMSSTPSPTFTLSPTVPATETRSSTPTAIATNTVTPTQSATATATMTSAASATPTATSTIAAPSSTATATATSTVGATATPSTVCGNGVLEDGETCATCAADCAIRSCTATTPVRTATINFTAPDGANVTGITVLVGYRSGTISLPGTGAASTVGARVKNKPSNVIAAVNDLDYALRVVLSRSTTIPAGRLFTVDFDGCQGAVAPTAASFGCHVEQCANTFGNVQGCTCSVAFP
ncbi:MAG TPA: hypothetical protein VMT89_07030 [Candidatus Acidoferrales bacterium]|nr:hypothetical protein [Candidatus Acidoferrales bacterium]